MYVGHTEFQSEYARADIFDKNEDEVEVTEDELEYVSKYSDNDWKMIVACLSAGSRPLSARLEHFDQIVYHDPLFTYFLHFLTSIFTQN